MSSPQTWWEDDAERRFCAFIRALPAKHTVAALEFAASIGLHRTTGVLNANRPAQVGETEEEWVDSFFFDDSIPRDDIARFRAAAAAVRAALDRATACFDAGDAVGVVKALCESLSVERGFGSRASTDKAARALLRPGWEVFRDGIEFSPSQRKLHLRELRLLLRRGRRAPKRPSAGVETNAVK